MALTGIAIAVLTSPSVQQSIIGKYTRQLSAELNADISVGRISYSFPATINLYDVYISDQHRDTLFFLGETHANLRLFSNDEHLIKFGNVKLDNVVVKFREYLGERDLNYEFFFDYLGGGGGPRDTTRAPIIWTITFDDVDLKNASFALKFDRDTVTGRQFNESDFRFNKIQASLHNFNIVDDSLAFQVSHLSLVEKNSFSVRHIEADARIHYKGMSFSDMTLITPHSHVGNFFAFDYESWKSFNDFENDVLMRATLKDGRVSFKDLAYFSDNLLEWDEEYIVDGEGSGPLSSLKGNGIRVQGGDHTELIGDFSLRGLPDVDNTLMRFELDKATTNTAYLSDMIHQELPENVKLLGKMSFQGAFTGFLTDFVAFGQFDTELGKAKTDINMKLEGSQGFSGTLQLINFEMGKFLEQPDLGLVTLSSRVEGKGYEISSMEAKLEGKAPLFTYAGYPYQNIDLKGLLRDHFFEGLVEINDPNLQLSFDGKIDLNSEEPNYDFVSNIRYADVQALGLYPVEPLRVQGKVTIDAYGSDMDALNGTVALKDVRASSKGKSFYLDSLRLRSSIEEDYRLLTVQSDVLDANMEGKFKLSELDAAVNNYLAQLLPNTLKLEKKELSEQEINFTIDFKRTREISEIFLPNAWLDRGSAKGMFSTEENKINLNLQFEGIHYEAYEFTGIQILADSASAQSIHLNSHIDRIYFADSVKLGNFNIDLTERNKQVKYALSMDGLAYDGDLALNGQLSFDDTSVLARFGESFMRIGENKWVISDTSSMRLTRWSDVEVPWFSMVSGDQSIQVKGRSYGTDSDNLRVNFNSFALSTFNPFVFPDNSTAIDGKADGYFDIISFKGKIPLFTSNLNVYNLQVDKDTFGDLSLKAGVKPEFEIINIDGKVINGSLNNLRLSGFVKTGARNNGYNLVLDLDTTEAKTFQPFLVGLVSQLEGNATARVRVFGPLSDPQLEGKVGVHKGGFLLDYLNTYYRFHAPAIAVNTTRVDLGSFDIFDNQNGRGKVSGFITHDFLSDFHFNINCRNLQRMMVLNTNEKQNDYYYGTAIMTGSAKFTGTVDQLKIDVKGKTDKGSVLFIPMENYYGTSELEFIRFVNEDEGYEGSTYQDLSGIEMNFDLDINPNAEIQLIFDSRLGDIIRARGNSEMNMRITSAGDFKMYGIYEIVEGDYLFTAVDLINKKYIIQKGGTITWDGDPLAAMLNLQANYKVQASTENLVAGLVPNEDLSVYRQKVPVEAIMKLRGVLTSPEIRFGIKIPDMSSLTAGSGGSVNTNVLSNVLRRIENDQEEMTRQVFSLLVANMFMRPSINQSLDPGVGTDIQSGLLSSSVGELLSNQITNWLNEVDPRWNLGVNFVPGSNSSDLIVNLGRKFFNDKIEIQTSFGTQSTANRVNFSYNIKPNLRINVINSTGTLNTTGTNTGITDRNRNINTQRVGLYYRIQFDMLSEERKAARRALDNARQNNIGGQTP